MDANSIVLDGSIITAIKKEGDTLRIRFEPAYIIRTMTGSDECTRWRQNGELVFEGVTDCENHEPALPVVCKGGDVTENIYTYRDMIPVPLESRGRAGCALILDGSDLCLNVQATAVVLKMDDVPKYIEHIKT